MPVTFVGLNGHLKLKTIGVNSDLIAQLTAKKAKIYPKADGIHIDLGGKLSHYAVQSTALADMEKSTLPWKHKAVAEIEAWLQIVLAGENNVSWVSSFSPPDTSPVANKAKIAAPPATVTSTVPEAYQKAVHSMIEHPPVPITMLEKMPMVPLEDAIGLYRPVKGTSPNSKYFMVAVFPGLKMAVKLKGHTMSTRVEGNGISGYMSKLSAMGFSVGTGYMSVHAPVDSNVTAAQYLGAMCAALGGSLIPQPDLGVIANKG